MSTLTVFADTTDGDIRSIDTTYATARSGGALTTSSQMRSGQQFSSPNYAVYECLASFDTSALTADATVSAAVLSLRCGDNQAATNFTVNARLYDWGTTLTTADWIAGASLAAQTLLAHFATIGISLVGYNNFTNDAFPANVNKTGATRVILDGSRTESGATPTGNEYVTWFPADTAGTTDDPKLVVTYTAPEAHSGSLAASAATSATASGFNPAVTGSFALATATSATASGHNPNPGPPALQVFIDWDNDGAFDTSGDDVTADLVTDSGVEWDRGRSADSSSEATGAASFVLTNESGAYSNNSNLILGRPVLIKSTHGSTKRAHFFGFIQRITPSQAERSVKITCYDSLRRLSEKDAVVPASDFIPRTARDMRVEVLSDFERGAINLCHNGSVETAITGWTNAATGMTVTRIATDAAPGLGSACVQSVSSGGASRTEFRLRLAPAFFAGQTYRFSVWLKWVSGTTAWTIGAFGGTFAGAGIADRNVTLTNTWTRYTFTVTLGETYTASQGLTFFIFGSPGTMLADGLMVSRGRADPLYTSDVSGRWPNWVGNGSFDAGSLMGWYSGWTNRCTNPSFAVDLTGWSAAADSFHNGGAGFGWYSAAGAHGNGYAGIAGTSAQGAHFALSGTFKAGTTYVAVLYLRGTATATVGIGSSGTPSDYSQNSQPVGAVWGGIAAQWTPTADRTDVHLYVKCDATYTVYVDAAMVAEFDAARNYAANECAIVLPAATQGCSVVGTSTTAKYGSKSHSFTTRPFVGAGRLYNLGHIGGYFLVGQPYTVSIWLRAPDAMPYRVGIAGATNVDASAWDSATTTGTLSPDTWTQVTLTWTPSADRSGDDTTVPFPVILFVEQTDATARTVLVDGVRVIPGSSVDAFEMPQWVLDTEDDAYLVSASLSGSALSALSQLNGLTLTRHFIRPKLTAPFYEYVTSSRDSLSSKASVETFINDFADLTEADLDRDSIVNLVGVGYSGKTEYYTDQPSVDLYGPQPGSDIPGSFFPDRTIPDAVGPALLARYGAPRGRPVMRVHNRFPSQLDRDLDDLITVTFGRLAISAQKYLILRGRNRATGSLDWTTEYTLEEYAF